MTDAFKNTLMWLLVGTVAVFVAMNWATASFTGVEYLPAGNDSFYHARRILDAWMNPAAFYEFDPRIHVPEGSWITWPWLYDYTMARVLRLVVPPGSAIAPMSVLVYFPVFWAYVTTGLVLAIAATLGLSRPLQAMAGLTAALLPLNQVLHGVGRVDHHFMEYTFVLLTLLGGLRWVARPGHGGRAAFLGFCLGIAPGFHNALFILQLPVLAALFVLWIRHAVPPTRATTWFAGALLLGTLLVVVPSEPFLKGWFSYYLLSTFHLYIAACTAILALIMSGGPLSTRRFLVLAGIGAAMLVPILGQVSMASDFFAHRVDRLSVIMEARSLLTIVAAPRGSTEIATQYSCLAFLVPVVFVGLLAWGLRERDPGKLFFVVFSVFGLFLLVQQFRMHYFGSFALYLPLLLLAAAALRRYPRRKVLVYFVTIIVLAGSFFPPVRHRIFAPHLPGLDSHYQVAGALMPELTKLCREDPGTVLIWNDAGHYVRFHTECAVIANNFLLTPQHSDKIREIDSIFASSLPEALSARPDIKYLLVHYPKVVRRRAGGGIELLGPDELRQANVDTPLMLELLEPEDPTKFPRLEFVTQVALELQGEGAVVARLFVVRPEEPEDQDRERSAPENPPMSRRL